MSIIEWLKNANTIPATWNPVIGCSPESEGCAHCYAARWALRLSRMGIDRYKMRVTDSGVYNGDVTLCKDELANPTRWRKPRTCFVCSMADLFHESLSYADIDSVLTCAFFARLNSGSRMILLTKRAAKMHEYHARSFANGFCGLGVFNIGVTTENQCRLEERYPHLAAIDAAYKFLSAEPLLGPLDLTGVEVDAVIVGGETGPGARHPQAEWVYSIQEQCARRGMRFFFKRWGDGRANDNLIDGRLYQEEIPWR